MAMLADPGVPEHTIQEYFYGIVYGIYHDPHQVTLRAVQKTVNGGEVRLMTGIYTVPNIRRIRCLCNFGCSFRMYCRCRDGDGDGATNVTEPYTWRSICYCTQFCQTWDKHHREVSFSTKYTHAHCKRVNTIFALTLFSRFMLLLLLLCSAIVCVRFALCFAYLPMCVRGFFSLELRSVLYLWMFNCAFPQTHVGNVHGDLVLLMLQLI